MREITAITLLGGDELHLALAEKFLRDGFFVYTAGLESAALPRLVEKTDLVTALKQSNCIIFPYDPCGDNEKIFAPYANVPLSFPEEILSLFRERYVFCGSERSLPRDFLPPLVFSYGAQSDFLVGKASLQVEGLLRTAIVHSGVALRSSSCLVLGYEITGELLARALLSLGAHVTVITDSPVSAARAALSGAAVFPFSRLAQAGQQHIIFRTFPCSIDAFALEHIAENAVLLDMLPDPEDLAVISARGLPRTHCVDLWRTTAPTSAGALLHDVILRMWREL